jgi:HK97 family phage major capsid protein
MSAPIESMNLGQMTVAQLRTEISQRYSEAKSIEDKYPNGLTPDVNHEDHNQAHKLLGEVDVLEDALAPKEEAEQRKARINGNVQKYLTPARGHQHAQADDVLNSFGPADPGAQFIGSDWYKQLASSGVLNSNRNRVQGVVPLLGGTKMLGMANSAEQKALVYSGTGVGGSLIRNDQRPGFLDLLQRDVLITDLIPSTSTDSDTIEYVREVSFTNNAAFVAEATATTGTSGLKPESALTYDTQTASVKTLAHWFPVTNKMMADAPAMRGVINQRLLLGLDLALESQIIDGDGSGENLTGILRTPGVLIQGVGTDNVMDAIYKARTQIMVTGLARPNGIVMHPNDWQTIRLSRENAATGTLGGYLYGPPSVQGPMTVFGLPVIEALGAVENTVLVGDFAMGAMIFDREQAQIRVGLIDDQLVRNMTTVLAELRMALVVFRPTAFARVTGA